MVTRRKDIMETRGQPARTTTADCREITALISDSTVIDPFEPSN